jgi:hypothetical protein
MEKARSHEIADRSADRVPFDERRSIGPELENQFVQRQALRKDVKQKVEHYPLELLIVYTWRRRRGHALIQVNHHTINS